MRSSRRVRRQDGFAPSGQVGMFFRFSRFPERPVRAKRGIIDRFRRPEPPSPSFVRLYCAICSLLALRFNCSQPSSKMATRGQVQAGQACDRSAWKNSSLAQLGRRARGPSRRAKLQRRGLSPRECGRSLSGLRATDARATDEVLPGGREGGSGDSVYPAGGRSEAEPASTGGTYLVSKPPR